MALRKIAPQHRVDSEIIFIHRDDDAWDHSRIETEKAELVQSGKSADEHPVERYWSGATRYDLGAADTVLGSAVAPRDYLGDGATRWKLRRLSRDEWRRVRDMISSEGSTQAFGFAFKRSVMDVSGEPALGRIGLDLSPSEDQRLADTFGDGVCAEVSIAVYKASEPLSEAEKKP